MRFSLFILVVLAAIIGIEKPAEAQNGGWCADFKLRIRRPKDLRVRNIATVLGRGARRWRELRTQSVLPAAVLSAVSAGLSLLIGLSLPQKLRQPRDI